MTKEPELMQSIRTTGSHCCYGGKETGCCTISCFDLGCTGTAVLNTLSLYHVHISRLREVTNAVCVLLKLFFQWDRFNFMGIFGAVVCRVVGLQKSKLIWELALNIHLLKLSIPKKYKSGSCERTTRSPWPNIWKWTVASCRGSRYFS